MGYSRDQASDSGTGFQYVRVARATSRSDLFPKLVTMQRSMNARNFAVFRVSGSGVPNKRKLVCELENWGASGVENGNMLIEACGETFLQHIELSLLPIVWNGSDLAQRVDTNEFAPMIRRLESVSMPFGGIAFPIRLGAVGNGYVAFLSNSLDLGSDMIVDQHVRSCQIMVDLLALEEKRALPSETLSEREIACLQLAGDGQISEEIAEKLGLSVHTVNAYLGSATIKLDSVNRIQAIAKAIRLGYIH